MDYKTKIKNAADKYEVAVYMDVIKFHNKVALVLSETYTSSAVSMMKNIADEFGKTYEQVLEDVRSFVD